MQASAMRMAEAGKNSGVVLLIAPQMSDEDAKVFDRPGFLRLDSLVEGGYAGVVYRRLQVASFLYPEMRLQADRVRREYLKVALPQVLMGQTDLVVVGTAPSDADLYDYASVDAMQFTEEVLAQVSCGRYGEPGMTAIEYSCVLTYASDSIDEWLPVTDWRDMDRVLAVRYPRHPFSAVLLDDSKQRDIMKDVAIDLELDGVWLEPEAAFNTPELKPSVVFQFDYLLAVRPHWRDAVVRVLLRAPSLRTFMTLPWFVFDAQRVGALCYARDSHGQLMASMRGESLVDFVVTNLNGVMTSDELVGTFIGALLCDPVVLRQAMERLRGRVLLPMSPDIGERYEHAEDYRVDAVAARVNRIPTEMMWMYKLCPDVVAYEWSGERDVAGAPLCDHQTEGEWHGTLSLAILMQSIDAEYPGHRSDIIAFMRRVYILGPTYIGFANIVADAIRNLNQGRPVLREKIPLLALVPGLQYLREVPHRDKEDVYADLGYFPSLDAVLHGLKAGPYDSRYLRMIDVAQRRELFDTGPVDLTSMSVGATVSAQERGYCYLHMFDISVRPLVKQSLGPYPMCSMVFSFDADSWRPRTSVKVYVSRHKVSLDGKMQQVLHFSPKQSAGSIPIDEFRKKFNKQRKLKMRAMRVGDDFGPVVCDQGPWKSVSIASLTINVLLAIVAITWLIRDCCLNKGRQVRRY